MSDDHATPLKAPLPLGALAALAVLYLVAGIFTLAAFFTDPRPQNIILGWSIAFFYSRTLVIYSVGCTLLFFALLKVPRWFAPAYWLFLSVGVVDAIKAVFPATLYVDSPSVVSYVYLVLALLLIPPTWCGVHLAQRRHSSSSGLGILVGLVLAVGTWLPIRLRMLASWHREHGIDAPFVGEFGQELLTGAILVACYFVSVALLLSLPRSSGLARPWAFPAAGLLCLVAAWPVSDWFALAFSEAGPTQWYYSSVMTVSTGGLSFVALLGASALWHLLANHDRHGAV